MDDVHFGVLGTGGIGTMSGTGTTFDGERATNAFKLGDETSVEATPTAGTGLPEPVCGAIARASTTSSAPPN